MRVLNQYDQYLSGDLSEAEKDAFTRVIVKDYFEAEALKEKWNAILDKDQRDATPVIALKPTPQRRIVVLRLLAAAASVLLLALAWVAYRTNAMPASEKLLATYLNEPYQESISRKGPIEDLQTEAIGWYNSKDYKKAAIVFEQIEKLDDSNNWAFYLGLCQLYQKQASPAIQYFEKALVYPNSTYTVETHWYLGLAHVLNKEIEKAKGHLEVVATHSEYEDGWKVQEAKALLNAFDE